MYICDKCGARFYFKDTLVKHLSESPKNAPKTENPSSIRNPIASH